MGKQKKEPAVRETIRTAPTLRRDDERNVTVLAKDEDQIRQLFGAKTNEAAVQLLRIGLSAFGQKGMDNFELVPALAVEMEPRDAVEAMLINQMAATHYAISSLSMTAIGANISEISEVYETSLTRHSRTFLGQIEALKKYRAKAQQVVRVETVEVKDGGQAVVGSVAHQGGG